LWFLGVRGWQHVDYLEKTSAAAKIPGGYFKREKWLTEAEVLSSRIIDRLCRPLFYRGRRGRRGTLAAWTQSSGQPLAACSRGLASR
jgi:hypothetical protein